MDNHPFISNLVSIMMPAYNAESFIAVAIESVIQQTYQSWELIIINDGSKDSTAEILSQFNDERIQVYHQQNAGEASARNHALSKMKGEYLAFLDSDDLFTPNFLENAVLYLQTNPKIDAVYCDGWYIDEQNHAFGSLSDQRRGPFEGNLFEHLVRASDVFGPPICTLIRREKVTERVLQFDTRIVIGPDWDFLTRLSETVEWGYLEIKGCRYRIHHSNITVTTGYTKRRDSLSRCREKMVENSLFQTCSLETRSYVFYDLLINLLYDQPNIQDSWINHSKFYCLPEREQNRLLRLTAVKSLISQQDIQWAKKWLKQALKINRNDIKTMFILFGLLISPNLMQNILQKRSESIQSKQDQSPFQIQL
jgi:glycosyltransferase involved in cell wall biosynthesis